MCQGDLKLSQKFLNDLIKTIIPTLIVTKQQIELENRQIINQHQNDFPAEIFQDGFMNPFDQIEAQNQICSKPSNACKKVLDLQSLLKNPSQIVNDSVKLACENLWNTLKQKVILKYNLTSEQMNSIIIWINLNLQSLSSIVLSRDPNGATIDTDKLQVNEDSLKNISPDNKLTTGQYHFLN